jgi:hypothetical protein
VDRSTRTTYDGKPIIAAQNEDGNPASIASLTISTLTAYEGLERVIKETNPHRAPPIAPTDGSAAATYDLLGRQRFVTASDGSSNLTGTVMTTYAGNQTTVQDQAGN